MSYHVTSYYVIPYHKLIHKYHSISNDIKYNDMMKEIISSRVLEYLIKSSIIEQDNQLTYFQLIGLI